MFDDMERMLDRIKKKVYRERMDYFREKNAQILSEMISFVEENAKLDEIEKAHQGENLDEIEKARQDEKRDEAAAQAAKAFADAVEARFARHRKINGRTQMDINLMMVYYVFPAILLTESGCAVPLADAIRDEWRMRFRDSEKLNYTTYENLCETFKEELFGIPRIYGVLPKV